MNHPNKRYAWRMPVAQLLLVICLFLLGVICFWFTPSESLAASPGSRLVQAVVVTPTAPHAVYIPLVSSKNLELPIVNPPVVGGIDPVINAVGDIAACSSKYFFQDGFLQTAALLQQLDGPILGLGDYIYPDGTAALYTNCFDPVWGQFKARIFPTPGNHDYQVAHAAGYYGYFGAAAGDPTLGYYSFDLGNWHIVALNSNCSSGGASNDCSAGSPQEQWLRADLAAHPNLCTLAFWHHPLYGSGEEGNTLRVRPLYQALIDLHADLILNGHNHDYERYAPQDANGNMDLLNGIPQIVVGTGGKDHSKLVNRMPNSLVFDNTSFGILRVALRTDHFDFQFIPVSGGTFADSGTGTCH